MGYAVYNTAALRGSAEPNLVPWLIWGFMAVLNNETYRLQTGDRIKAMLTTAGSIAAIVTLIVAVIMGGAFHGISITNEIALAIGAMAVVAWKFGSAKYANYCVLAAITSGFVPFYKVLWSNPKAESPLAWGLWTLSTTLGVIVVSMRKHKKSDFVMPSVLAILHSSTFVLTLM
jgi:hypothetical protein